MFNKETLMAALAETESAQNGSITIKDIDVEGVFGIEMNSHGDMGLMVSIADDVIRISTDVIHSSNVVADEADFNRTLLLAQSSENIPLSNFALRPEEDGAVYELVGELSANSKLEVIVQEIFTLAENTVGVAELISEINVAAESA